MGVLTLGCAGVAVTSAASIGVGATAVVAGANQLGDTINQVRNEASSGGSGEAAESASKRPELVIDDAQFGTKVGRHASDFGLNPADPAARDFVRSRITDIHASPSEIRQGPWNPKGGGGTDHLFYRQEQDVVVTRSGGDFVTILKGGESNGWFRGATVVWP